MGDKQHEGLGSIGIYCRFAPPPADEQKLLNHAIKRGPQGHAVAVRDDYSGSTLEMECEIAFDGGTTQMEVHEQVTEPLIPNLLKGYNCTLLAFGQTASGKTHTMLGPQGGRYDYLRKDQNCGIVPRAVVTLFDHLRASEEQAEVDFSYFEIYNEVVSDLIAKATSCDGDLKSFAFRGTDKARFEREVSRVRVRSADEFLHILEATTANRQQGGTDLNQVSSRSHSVVLLRVHTNSTSATMCMVDLAGSECIKKSNAQGLRRYETKNINTSLFALKQVIHALYKKKDHVPYADSMLTRTLADSLSGNAFLKILVCCTSRAEDVQETMTTLRFAKEASCVVRKPPSVNRHELFRQQQLMSAGDYDLLTTERNTLLTQNEEFQKQNDSLFNENAVLQMQVRQLQDTNTQLIQQIHQGAETYQSQVVSLQTANDHLQKRARELQEGEMRSGEQNAYLTKKVAEVQKHMEGILAQIKAVTVENDTLRAELRQSRSSLDSLKQQVSHHQQHSSHGMVQPYHTRQPSPPDYTNDSEATGCQRITEELNRLNQSDRQGFGGYAQRGGSDDLQQFQQQQQLQQERSQGKRPGSSLSEPLLTAEEDALTARLQRLEQVLLRPASSRSLLTDNSSSLNGSALVPP